MKPLHIVVALCLVASTVAVEKKADKIEPVLQAEDSGSQTRKERCTTCSGGYGVGFKAPGLAQLQALPAGEVHVHTQQSFEGCSSEKGCAGIKVKDGQVVEKFGNVDAFKAAAAADTANEFQFHPNHVFDGGIPNGGPFWWMNQNSPFKNGAASASGGGYEKFSKSSSSFTSSGNAANGGFNAGLDLSANPFLNGELAKVANNFAGAQAEVKPSTFQSSSFESSSFSTSNKEVDVSKNPFLNGNFQGQNAASQGFQAQGAFGSNSQGFSQNSGFNKAQAGYTGSSPSPFTASTGGSNVNLIQNSQKASEFEFEQQQQQQSIDEAFQGTGNVFTHDHSGGEIEQTCAGQGYVCVHKAQCNNGVVNTNGASVLQAKTKKQYCNTKTEICCRIEISSLAGAGGLQGSLGVGGATYSGSGSQGGGLFVSNSQGSSSSSSSGSNAQGFGQTGQAGQAGQGFAGQGGQSGQSGFESSSFESSSSTFTSRGQSGQGAQGSQGTQGFQGSQGSQGTQGSQGANAFGAQGNQFGSGTFESSSSSTTFESGSTGFQGGQGNFGNNNVNNANRGGVSTVESSSSTFESSSRGSSGTTGAGAGFGNRGTGNGFGQAGFGQTAQGSSFGAGTGSTFTPGNVNNNANAGGVNTVYKQTSQTNFIETDSFSAGSENQGAFRPGQNGLKPGVPYLPPVDTSISGSNTNFVSSSSTPAYIPPAPRPTPPRPAYIPPVSSTSAPGYLPPEVPESSINTETRVPAYDEGSIILDENRRPRPKPAVPAAPSEIPSACAAALKCTPIEFCTAEGVISNTTVILTKDQDAYRVPLTDCKDLETGRIGKCCRDPYYTDPWPANQLGKWVPGVFGGNDGKYSPDSRGSGSIARPIATARPPVTGSTVLNNFRTPKPTIPPFGPNQVTPGFPATSSTGSFAQKKQFEVRGQGQFGQAGQGSFSQGGQGSFAQGGQGQFGAAGAGQREGGQYTQSQFSQTTTTFGQGAQGAQGQGQLVSQGQGQLVSQGQGQFGQGGRGQFGAAGQIQESGGQSQFSQTSSQKTFGQTVVQGQNEGVSQGFGSGVSQGAGFAVSQGAGFGQENEYSESSQRVFLQQYSAGGQCGVFSGQKPFGNRNELEVDFAEIPWQAMVLLQTNKSLLCGGVITRPDVVITSAACVEGLEAKNVLIKGGEWKLGIDDEPLPFQIVQVKTILRHPFYKRGSLHYDAAILVLSENLRWSKNIYPICLPRAGETVDAFYNGAGECIVTGWGKQVLQAHLSGSILHSLNVSLVNPGECQSKLSSDYPHLLEQYDQESCVCGQPTNPVNNICKVDIGSALACTTDDKHWVLRGVYSWDSGCQLGNQLAAFYKFDLEWYEWAIGLIESARFAQYTSGSAILSQNRYSGQINSGIKGAQVGGRVQSGQYSGVKGQSGQYTGVKGQSGQYSGVKGGQSGQYSAVKGQGFGQQGFGQGQFASGFSQFSQFSSAEASAGGANFGGQIKGAQIAGAPVTNSFSASFSEKKVYQSEPKIVTYTTKPEIVTFTTKPEYFTFTTKPKLVTYTTKPQVITYETSGSGTNPQYIAPGVTFNPSFASVVGHKHNAQCKCLEKK